MISTYKKADNVSSKIKCIIAKFFHAQVVSPLGRLVLLPSDYEKMEREYVIDGELYCNRCCKPLSKKGNAKISMTIYEDDDFIDTLETEKCCAVNAKMSILTGLIRS